MQDIYDRYNLRIQSAYKVLDENGNEVVNNDPIMRDGQRQVVPLQLMDAEAKAIKDARLAERDRVRAEIDAKLFSGSPGRGYLNTDALTMPPPNHRSAQLSNAEQQQRDRVYQNYNETLCSAWRNPPTGV